MPHRLTFALALLLAAPAAHAATDLPDACGKDDVHFKVKTTAPAASLQRPEDGKGQIVFLETLYGPMLPHPLVRFGLDGAWTGASKGNGYFVVSAAPGEHHLCAAWQSSFSMLTDHPGAMPLHVEAGKTYFIDYEITSAGKGANVIRFHQLNDDEARFFLRTYPVTTWTSQ